MEGTGIAIFVIGCIVGGVAVFQLRDGSYNSCLVTVIGTLVALVLIAVGMAMIMGITSLRLLGG